MELKIKQQICCFSGYKSMYAFVLVGCDPQSLSLSLSLSISLSPNFLSLTLFVISVCLNVHTKCLFLR